MRVVGYVRVSSQNPEHQETSAREQERAVRAWCRAEGHRLARIYHDVGVSGAQEVDKRLGLPTALEALSRGAVDGLVVRELDRLHRDVMIQEAVFSTIWELRPETTVFSTKPAEAQNCTRDDPDDPSRRFVRHILGATSDYVRTLTVAKMRAGKRAKARRGGFVGGRVGYGYRAVSKELQPEPAEQAVIRRVRELDRAGGSSRQIAAVLNEEGIPAKRGGRWHSTTVLRLLGR